MSTTTRNRDIYSTIGKDVSQASTMEEILQLAGANFEAETRTPFIETEHGNEAITSHNAIVRSDDETVLSVMGKGYQVLQYSEIMEYALEAVDLRAGDAAVTRAAAYNDGKQFFASVDLGSLFIDPDGVADEIGRNLVVMSSHDGTIPIVLASSNIRFTCMNQSNLIKRTAPFKVIARHTKNVRERMVDVKRALGIAERVATIFEKQAIHLLGAPANFDTVKRTADKIWEAPGPEAKDAAVTRYTNRLDTLERIWEGPTNTQVLGENDWAVYNVFTEYFDHYSGRTEEKRALASMKLGGQVEKAKFKVGELLHA